MIQEPQQLLLFEAEEEYNAEPNYPSHRAKTALELMQWVGKSGRIRGRIRPKVKVIDCRHCFGGVHVLVTLDGQREWYSTAAIEWPFITDGAHI